MTECDKVQRLGSGKLAVVSSCRGMYTSHDVSDAMLIVGNGVGNDACARIKRISEVKRGLCFQVHK